MTETFDFIVVGSGGGSMCAALVMRDAGKRVLILEKTALLGGTTALSGGVMWIPNNRFMKEAGVNDSRDMALTYMAAVAGDTSDAPAASRERQETYVDKAPEMIDFLVDKGIKLRRIPSWPDYQNAPGNSIPGRTVVSQLYDLKQLGDWTKKLHPGFLPLAANLDEAMQLPTFKRSWSGKKVLAKVIARTVFGKLRGKNLTTAGQALQGQMLESAVKAGVDIRINAGVTKLVVENDRVVGVIVGTGSEEKRIDANLGVLLNAGGFARNQAMIDQYIPGTKASWSSTNPGDTGEMIQESMALGAAIAQMEERVGNPTTELPGGAPNPAMQGDLAKPHSIVVNQRGERFMKEAASYSDICKNILAHNQQTPAMPCWLVLDSQYLEKYMLMGTMPGSKKPQAWYDENVLRKAETLDGLAEKCGLPADTLKSTVERFNGFVRNNKDEDFLRGNYAYDEWLGDPLNEPSHTLGNIEKGPFYAIPIYPGDVSTTGGLLTDARSRVLREDGSPIAGLFATGVTTASVFGRGSVGAGSNIGPSFTWGYVAAKHALQHEATNN